MLQAYKQHLSSVLSQLEKSHDEMIKSNGYNKKTELSKILSELIKEQIQNENTDSSTRKTW